VGALKAAARSANDAPFPEPKARNLGGSEDFVRNGAVFIVVCKKEGSDLWEREPPCSIFSTQESSNINRPYPSLASSTFQDSE
jgi:hypothetical protein